MTWSSVFSLIRRICSSVGILYVFLGILTLSLVDVRAVISRFQMRNINDAYQGMDALVSFNAGSVTAQEMNWVPYLNYFGLVVKYVSNEPVSEMFLGICQYYAGNSKDQAWGRIRHSAETNPFIFWNIYNAGVLAFERGELGAAISYFEKALVLPEERILEVMRASVVYRQVMVSGNFNTHFVQELRNARENVHLFLAAANFYSGNHEKARDIAVYCLEKTSVTNKEPFLFYAGAAELYLGRGREALALLGKCIELRSRNPMVYRYAGQILKRLGNVEAAESMFSVERSLGVIPDNKFPYADRLKLRFF